MTMTPEVLPALLEGRRQERAARDEQAEVAAELAVDAAEDAPPDAHRQVPGDAAQSIEGGGLAALLDLARDGAPEQVEDLRDDDHRGDLVVAQGIEDDARVPAADVQDVGADAQRVEQPDRLLEEVRQRQERHDPVFEVRHDRVERLDRGQDVVVGEHHALRDAGRPRREHELEDVVLVRRLPGGLGRFPVGREGRDRRRRARRRGLRGSSSGTCSRRASRGSGASRPVPRMRWRVSAALHDVLDGLDRHAQVQRHVDEASAHRPEVGGRELRHGRAPGQDPVARLEAEGPQAPGRDPAPPLELAEGPRARGPVVGAQAQGGLVAVARDGLVEQAEKRGGHATGVAAAYGASGTSWRVRTV